MASSPRNKVLTRRSFLQLGAAAGSTGFAASLWRLRAAGPAQAAAVIVRPAAPRRGGTFTFARTSGITESMK